MTEPTRTAAAEAARAEREAREAAALRENLRKRKAQASARAQAVPAEPGTQAAAAPGDGPSRS